MYNKNNMKYIPFIKFGLDNDFITVRTKLDFSKSLSDKIDYILKKYFQSILDKYNLPGSVRKERDMSRLIWCIGGHEVYWSYTSIASISNFYNIIVKTPHEELDTEAQKWKLKYDYLRRSFENLEGNNHYYNYVVSLPYSGLDGTNYQNYLLLFEELVRFTSNIYSLFGEVQELEEI